ncbi:hypothetical protein [Rhodanobacter panaciterrae]|nr:hypothetical protein [Rhodanobacter panaciterrae]
MDLGRDEINQRIGCASPELTELNHHDRPQDPDLRDGHMNACNIPTKLLHSRRVQSLVTCRQRRTIMNPPATTQDAPEQTRLDENICVHIFTASAAMVGVCLTVVGIIRVVISQHKSDLFADDLLAVNAMLYLISSLLSYWALRTRNVTRNYRLERTADIIFLVALTLTAVSAAYITWAMSVH